MEKVVNYGVKIGYGPNDYWANKVSGVLFYEERNPNGNYEPYLPDGEKQWNDGGDSMSCVSFGITNGIESEEKRTTGIQPNYSDRWLAKMSNTDREGNYLHIVAETVRKYGLVLEEDYPVPTGSWNWDEYHKPIPEPLLSELKAKGKEWLEKWAFNYEWVDTSKESLMKHLKHGPIIVVLPGHLVLNFRTQQDIIHYFDSYAPFKKTRTRIDWAMKLVLTSREKSTDPDALLVNLHYGDFGKNIEKLLKTLRRLGHGYGITEDWKPMYDNRVASLVSKYKLSNVCKSAWERIWERYLYKGKSVDLKMREIVNKTLKFRK